MVGMECYSQNERLCNNQHLLLSCVKIQGAPLAPSADAYDNDFQFFGRLIKQLRLAV